MSTTRRRATGVMCLALAFGLSACTTVTSTANRNVAPPAEPTPDATISIAAPSSMNSGTFPRNAVEPLTELLNRETPYDLLVSELGENKSVAAAVRTGDIDIGLVAGIPAALAIDSGGVDPLAAWPAPSLPAAECVVPDDSQIESLSALPTDSVVAFSDAASTTGHKLSVHLLAQAGKTIDEDYETTVTGNFSRSVRALDDGSAAIACSSYLPIGEDDGTKTDDLRSVGASPALPASLALLGSTSMAPEKRDAVLNSLATRASGEYPGDLIADTTHAPSGTDPIIEPDPNLFQPLIDAACTSGAFSPSCK